MCKNLEKFFYICTNNPSEVLLIGLGCGPMGNDKEEKNSNAL